MAKPMHLTCPVEDCELDIKVFLEPGSPGSFSEPPYTPSIDDIEAPCGHASLLSSGIYDKELWSQIEEEENRAYDDAMEARYDQERDRWADDY